jgi:hypothetical protein
VTGRAVLLEGGDKQIRQAFWSLLAEAGRQGLIVTQCDLEDRVQSGFYHAAEALGPYPGGHVVLIQQGDTVLGAARLTVDDLRLSAPVLAARNGLSRVVNVEIAGTTGRERGAGRKLTEGIMSYAAELGLPVVLTANSDKAEKFWTHMGFVRAAPDEVPTDEWVMILISPGRRPAAAGYGTDSHTTFSNRAGAG